MAHKGEILEKVISKKNPNKTDVGRIMGYDRATIYRHYKDPDLEDGIILKYGKAFKYDFSKEFPHLTQYVNLLQEPLADYKPFTISEALKEIDYWKDKYIDLLEKYNQVLLNK